MCQPYARELDADLGAGEVGLGPRAGLSAKVGVLSRIGIDRLGGINIELAQRQGEIVVAHLNRVAVTHHQ